MVMLPVPTWLSWLSKVLSAGMPLKTLLASSPVSRPVTVYVSTGLSAPYTRLWLVAVKRRVATSL